MSLILLPPLPDSWEEVRSESDPTPPFQVSCRNHPKIKLVEKAKEGNIILYGCNQPRNH